VGVGLAISWVTSAIAYLRAGASTYTTLIEFQLVLSILFIALAYLADTDRRRKREP
jgi:uncharacterized membrane protein YciS (DUF1049 family)